MSREIRRRSAASKLTHKSFLRFETGFSWSNASHKRLRSKAFEPWFSYARSVSFGQEQFPTQIHRNIIISIGKIFFASKNTLWNTRSFFHKREQFSFATVIIPSIFQLFWWTATWSTFSAIVGSHKTKLLFQTKTVWRSILDVRYHLCYASDNRYSF